MNTYTIAQFAKMTGYAVKTLQKWDRDGKLVPLRTPTNRRLYIDEHLRLLRGMAVDQPRKTVAYMRVSSQAQKPDLKNQRAILEQFCAAKGIAVDEWIEEIGGGLNFKRAKFLSIVSEITTGKLEKLVIAHKDRIARFGFDLLTHLAQENGCEIVVLNTESLSPEQELVQDLMTITHCFSARLYGLRNYRKALKKAVEDDTSAQDQAESNT
ncbi:MAG: IS607 family transposase [Caldilineaceae bacterium]